MLAKRLQPGDCIGVISPSRVARPEEFAPIFAAMEAAGFRVRAGKNLYRDTNGFLASDSERAQDLNDMIADKDVRLVFFSGGEGGLDILPLIDYEGIQKNPQLFLSYSDGTSILNAIHFKTGLVTYYGQTPGDFAANDAYNRARFNAFLMRGDEKEYVPRSPWRCLTDGRAQGKLVGGYTLNFALNLGTPYFHFEKDKPYILFLEDHEKFSNEAAVDMYLSYIEQHPFFQNVRGFFFGHYSENPHPNLYKRIRRIGERWGIPTAYTDDFGHGLSHAVLPIGGEAALEIRGDRQTLRFL